jgi:copper chaperone CopZ
MIYFHFSLNAQDKTRQKAEVKQIESTDKITQIVERDTVIYKIYGMDCPGCQGALEKQINKLSCVSSAKANWLNQEIMIVVKKDSVLNEDELFKRIKKANFTPGKKR